MALNRNEVGLQFTISVDLGNSVRQLQSFQDQIRATAKRIQVDMAAAADTIRKTTQQTSETVKKSTSEISSAFSELGGLMTVGVTAPLVAAGAAAVKAALDFDKTRNQLIALTGSASEANRVIDRLRKLVAETPGLTQSFAQEAFNQLKAIGTIGEETILQITKALGTLTLNVGLPDPQQFTRNIVQIFNQGFERADIKEALGQVPFFEELLVSVFGTKDPAKLKQLKESGQLTLETFLSGFGVAVEARFPTAVETFTSRFQKAIDRLTIAITPLGTRIIEAVLPPLEKLINVVVRVLDAFNRLSPGTQEFIVKMGLVAAAIGPTILGLTKLFEALSRLGPIIGIGASGGLVGALGRLGGAFSTLAASHPIMAAAILGVGALALAFYNLGDTIDGLKKDFADIQKDGAEFFLRPFRKQRDVALQNADRLDRAVRSGLGLPEKQYPRLTAAEAPQAALPAGVGETGPAAQPLTQAQLMQRQLRMQYEARLKGMKDAQAKGVKATVDYGKLIQTIEEEQGQQSLRLFEAQQAKRLALLKQRFSEEEISSRFGRETLRLQMQQLSDEMVALGAEGDRLRGDQARTKSAEERLTIERELVRITGEQAVKLIEIDRLLQERAQREPLPVFQIDPAQVQQAIEQIDPLLQSFRDRQKARAEEVARLEVDAIRTRTEIIKIENQVDLGMMTRTQAQERINALLKQERDQRIAALQVQLQALDISEQQRASLEQQIVALQTQGETAGTGGFMQGLSQMSAGIGDLSTMALQAFDSMAQGMGQLIEQFAMTGQIGAQAFRQLATSVVAGLAKQAAVKAIYELAEGFAALALAAFGVPNAAAAAAGHFKAAALFGAVSGAAVAAGRAIAPGGSSESGGTGGRFVTGGGGQPQTISLIQGQQGNRREPQVIVIRAETEPGVVVRKVVESYRDNGEMRQLIRQDILQGAM